MDTRRFHCTVLTPVIMAGADKQSPEMREASLKGIMRYWWRAAMAESDLKRLRAEESCLFGSAGAERGSDEWRSPVTLKITKHRLETESVKLLPHKQDHPARAQAIKPDEMFEILISSPAGQIDVYSCVVQLSLILGGLGRRSRRGFGSVEVTSIGNKALSEPDLKSIQSLMDMIRQGFYMVRENRVDLTKDVSAGYPFIKSVEIGRPERECNKLLCRIGQASSDFMDDSLGFARGQQRFASPVWVSIIRSHSTSMAGFAPVVTTLNTAAPRGSRINMSKQDRFKEAVLK